MKQSLPLLAAFVLAFAPALSQTPPAIHIEPQSARPGSLKIDDKEIIRDMQGGGFRLVDAVTKKEIALPDGTVSQDGASSTFETTAGGLKLRTKFTPREKFILVTGEIENAGDEDRGFLVDYRIPFRESGSLFSSDLAAPVTVSGGAETESNVFPVAALAGGGQAVALAIPPTDPRVFGLVGSDQGLSIRFYLGVSPKTKQFPRRAGFSFLIYGADPQWGFRSALSSYYRFFPEYYTPRLKKDGLYMFQMGDRLPENVEQYGFDLFEPQLPSARAALERDQKNGITTFPYMIVGQREIKYLPALPTTYEEALGIYEKWTPASHAPFALCKENACAEGDIYLKDEVANSAVRKADGQYAILVRNTRWGDNSVTFKINPSPYLFEGEHRHTVGADALALADRWLAEHPEYGGLFIDSLGANWPAVLNYRDDHFAYARYPLTVDPDGRVALDNALSHYEYINALRDKVRAGGRLLNGNGVYAYNSKKAKPVALEKQVVDAKKNEFIAPAAPPEIYRPGAKVSRFFLAALLDVASCEFGSKATVEQAQDCRVLLGPKQFAFLNYQWEDKAKVEEFVNKSLAFGIFASTTTNFFSGMQYETHPEGYRRDKALLDWYIPLVRRLSQAGWEPVRGATIEGEGVVSERFGRGDTTYLTVFNGGERQQQATVRLDLAALGFTAENVALTEIGRQTPVSLAKDGSVVLTVDPAKAYVLQLSKRAPVAQK